MTLKALRGLKQLTHTCISYLSVVIVLLSMLVSLTVRAQTGAGTIQGTVTDGSGGAIAGAVVTVKNNKTGLLVTSKTNSTGFYVVPGLFTGSYTLSFTQASFQTVEQQFQLQVGQTAQIDISLPVGSVDSKVEVKAEDVQLVTTDTGAVSSVIENERINQLPMDSRQIISLVANTTPGVEGGQRANGNFAEALEYVQDGVPMMNRNFGSVSSSNFGQFPDPDAVQQMRIVMAASNAQYATPGTVVVTTKSGTNHIHGSAFGTFRNNAFGVAKGRNFGATGLLAKYIRNEFGVNVGGPILIPKVYDGHDKSFFFFAFERYSLRSNTAASAQAVTVPTVAMRNGDFSGLANTSTNYYLYNPATTRSDAACLKGQTSATVPTTTENNPFCRDRFPNNVIPQSMQSPLSKILNTITPLPTTTDNPLIRGNLYIPTPFNQTAPNTTFRLDHAFNQNNRAFLRYTDVRQTQLGLRNAPTASPATLAYQDFPEGASGYQLTPVSSVTAATGFTHVFSPTFISESTGGMQWFNQQVTGGGNVNLNYEQMLGLPNNFGETGFPLINGGMAMQYGGTQFNYGQAQIVMNFDENLTKLTARHKINFGARFRHERFGYLPDRLNDAITFGSQGSALYQPSTGANYSAYTNTGNVNADYYLGAASSYSVRISSQYVHFSAQELDAYVQDSWRLAKGLTVEVGVRWEAHPGPHTDGLVQAFDLQNKAVVMENPIQYYIDKGFTTSGVVQNLLNLGVKFETPSEANLPSHIFKNYYNLFSPRVGFAYAPWGARGFVFRAGYGRYVYPRPTRNSVATSVVTNQPFSAVYTQSYLNTNTPDGKNNYWLRNPITVVAGLNSDNVINTAGLSALTPGQTWTTLNPHDAPQTVQQLAVTGEQPLPGDSALRVTYIYNHGSNLDQAHRYNQPVSPWLWETRTGTTPPTGTYSGVALNPYDNVTYGANIQINPTGLSNNNSLQVNYQHLYKHGYAFQAFYVYSVAFRIGGNSTRDSFVYSAADFDPSLLQGTDYKSLNRQQNYLRDTGIPKHHIVVNGLLDFPVGNGKWLMSHAPGWANEIVGGWQIAGVGHVLSQSFQVNATNWGTTAPLTVYRGGTPITDCRSGNCFPAKLWFNGFIQPNIYNGKNSSGAACAGTPTITGMPADYTPYESPVNVSCTASDNNKPVKLNNGTTVQVAYNPGPSGVNPFSHTILSGPIRWYADASLFKVFPIHDSVSFRLNVDAFNVFNVQGYVNPDPLTGIQNLQSRANNPRTLQLSGRITF